VPVLVSTPLKHRCLFKIRNQIRRITCTRYLTAKPAIVSVRCNVCEITNCPSCPRQKLLDKGLPTTSFNLQGVLNAEAKTSGSAAMERQSRHTHAACPSVRTGNRSNMILHKSPVRADDELVSCRPIRAFLPVSVSSTFNVSKKLVTSTHHQIAGDQRSISS
jgi:hypothetical protein